MYLFKSCGLLLLEKNAASSEWNEISIKEKGFFIEYDFLKIKIKKASPKPSGGNRMELLIRPLRINNSN